MNSTFSTRIFLLLGSIGIALCLLALRAEPLAAQSGGTIPGPDQFLPIIRNHEAPPVSYDAVNVDNSGACQPDGRPAAAHGDLNLALRGYESAAAPLTLVEYNGPTDADAPQLPGLFSDRRLPEFTGAYQIYDWDWGCDADGCRGELLTEWPVTLLELAATQGEPLSIPSRGPRIDGADHKALVLYAEATRLTLAYTRHDSAACGYVIHLEGLRVEPSLVSFYQALDQAGRSQLPGLDNGERLGAALTASLKVAVRDTGRFMDPRARKDWWQEY
ncbi:MAG: hypothetical protein H6642_07995 [Caldilineaceae bacterium]|nr:hypothetical protein [Caldilineaceae bacterium]